MLEIFNFNWGSMPFASSYQTTSTSAVAIGYATGNSSQYITFSQPISGVSLWFNFIDNGTVFDFRSLNWTFVAGNRATRSGNTVISTGTNSQNDGFLINVSGSFGPSTGLSFITTHTGSGDTAGFTLGAPAPAGVPEPGQFAASMLLLAGIGGYAWIKHKRNAKYRICGLKNHFFRELLTPAFTQISKISRMHQTNLPLDFEWKNFGPTHFVTQGRNPL
jgi:hypothetical protein